MKLCTVCGVVTSRSGSRCAVHARLSNRSRHNALYSTRAWQRLSARVIARHRGHYGEWCPGYRRDHHPASDLTADHIVPLAAGGAALDIDNLAVLCRSCNSTKGATEPDRGVPTRRFRTPGRPRSLYPSPLVAALAQAVLDAHAKRTRLSEAQLGMVDVANRVANVGSPPQVAVPARRQDLPQLRVIRGGRKE